MTLEFPIVYRLETLIQTLTLFIVLPFIFPFIITRILKISTTSVGSVLLTDMLLENYLFYSGFPIYVQRNGMLVGC